MIWPHFQRNFLTEQNETIKATFCVLSDQNSLRLYFLCYEPTEPNISQPMQCIENIPKIIAVFVILFLTLLFLLIWYLHLLDPVRMRS